MKKTLRIGTRDSELALWQAHQVRQRLEALGQTVELVSVKSTGDLVLNKPLYELGITGIFTKTLDVAMLSGQVDIAVHSMKDVPTALPQGIVKAAVLERGNTHDIMVFKGDGPFAKESATVATGSLRRQAQWLNRYPNHQLVDLRGNVNTRMQKLQDNPWDGAIFAQAGLERIGILPQNHSVLDWMLPAPAQGAMMVVAMEKDTEIRAIVEQLNHTDTDRCTQIERDFLKTLEGGCTAPIAAQAKIEDGTVYFEGNLLSLDGSQCLKVRKETSIATAEGLGIMAAQELLAQGGDVLMAQIKKQLQK